MTIPAGLKQWAFGKMDGSSADGEIGSSNAETLRTVSLSLTGVSLLFFVAFLLNGTVSLTWFFLSQVIAFPLIPRLAETGYPSTAKFLLIAYVNVAVIILSSVFGKDMLIQLFLVPAGGLSILLFDKSEMRLRTLGIGLTVFSYFVLDYIIFDYVFITSGEFVILRGGILAAAFITTWMVFNKFSESKEKAERKTKELNRELLKKKEELEQKVEQLEKTKARAERNSRAKTEFLSTISHEIRTPMNAIVGMTNLLSREDPREDQLEQIEILDFSAQSLLSLINDVLNLSKIESGKIELEKSPFELQGWLRSVVDSFRHTANSKGINLLLDIEEKIPAYILGDATRLTQILNNLIRNAIKFTKEGGVVVGVHLLQKLENRVRIQFNVADTGIGISEEKKEIVFESFAQEESDTTRRFGGTGLGLTISKKLVEMQGGNIYLDSTKGQGSTFTVVLDFEVADAADRGSETDREGRLRNTHILVVEDNMINQKVIERFLQKWEVSVSLAEDGEEAIKIVKENDIDLIFMDLQMPQMDGYETTRAIRELEDTSKSNLPIIALTAAALSEVKKKVYAVGMNDFITKPFDPESLREKIKQHLPNGTSIKKAPSG